MNDDIENNSLMANYKDCRPADFNSLFSNSTIAEQSATKGGKKGIKSIAVGNNSLSINKTLQEKEHSKKALMDRHSLHLNKVNQRRATLS